jgi:hypothetical protein
MKTRIASKTIYNYVTGKPCLSSGLIPDGLEYFQGTYNDRPIEFSLYANEAYNPPAKIQITYLDVGECGPVEVAEVDSAELGLDGSLEEVEEESLS